MWTCTLCSKASVLRHSNTCSMQDPVQVCRVGVTATPYVPSSSLLRRELFRRAHISTVIVSFSDQSHNYSNTRLAAGTCGEVMSTLNQSIACFLVARRSKGCPEATQTRSTTSYCEARCSGAKLQANCTSADGAKVQDATGSKCCVCSAALKS